MSRVAIALAVLVALALPGVADARERTPKVSVADARQAAQQVADNLGGGVVTTCVRRSPYFVKCRAELTSTPIGCHVWVHAHAHNGYTYWPLPRFASCDDGQLVRIGFSAT